MKEQLRLRHLALSRETECHTSNVLRARAQGAEEIDDDEDAKASTQSSAPTTGRRVSETMTSLERYVEYSASGEREQT